MKKVILIFLLSQFFLSNLFSQKTTTIEGYDAAFSIDFEGEPTYTTDTSEIEGMQIINELWYLTVEDESHPNSQYSLLRIVYPSVNLHSDSSLILQEEVINSSQSSFFEDENNELLVSSDISKNQYFGKEFRWKNRKTNTFFTYHVYMVESSLYLLGVFTHPNENHNKSESSFFDSFKLADTLKGKYKKEENDYVQTYHIDFPEKPTLTTQTVDSPLGKLSMNIQVLELETVNPNNLYMTNEATYPDGFLTNPNEYELNTFYINSINGSLKSMNGQLITISDIFYKDKLGKEFRCYIGEGIMLAVYRIFIIENTLYSIVVMTTPENDKNEEMMKFFDSFDLK